MRIVIDMQGAQTESRFRGIGRYTMSLAQAIVRNRGEHEIILALSGLFPDTIETIRAAFDGLLPQENIRVWHAPGPVREEHSGNESRREVAELIREAFLASLRPDVIHISSLFEGYVDDAVTSIGRFDQQTPVSVILYDLIPLLNPEHYLKPNPRFADYYQRKIDSLKRASRFLAISEFSRQEGLEQLDVPATNVVNISTAIDEHFKPQPLDEASATVLRQKFNISRPFVLYTGGADERKNLPRLIEAYAALPPGLRASHQLVFAGQIHLVGELKYKAQTYQLKADELAFTGYMTDQELIELYNLCRLYVFPSWHEGFGLPALEAMACGAPVIGANTSSLPEVIGLGEALFDPFDIAAITQIMAKALEDGVFRSRLHKHGLQQAKKFSWDATATRAIAAWETLPTLSMAGYQERSSARTRLFQAIAKHTASTPENELVVLSHCLAQNEQAGIERQLLLDVSELCQHDAATGVQRVVRSYLRWLLHTPPEDFRVEPVYATREKGYRYARAFTQRFLGLDTAGLVDEPVRWQRGDIFFGLDMQHHVQLAQAGFYQQIKQAGVTVKFLVYDLLPIQLADLFKDSDAKSLHEQWLATIAATDGAICISKASADAFEAWIEQTGIKISPTFRTNWVHIGADIEGSKPSAGMPDDAEYVLYTLRERPTFLCVSTIEPRKRQQQILEATELLWKQGADLNLVLVGQQGWKVEALAERLRQHKEIGKRLFWLQGISDEYLNKIYAASTCLIAASINEGFGLSLIEAARHGIPVVARDIPVFREVAGEHAFYFNAESAEELASALQEWLTLHSQNKHPQSQAMPWSTWQQSTEQLKSALVKQNYSRRQLLVDVSELYQRDAKTGVQRVVRSILQEWLINPPAGYFVEPVYASVEHGYRYARKFIKEFMGGRSEVLGGEADPVEYSPGDVFVVLDLNHHVPRVHARYLRQLGEGGVALYFLVYDLLPIQFPRFWEEKHRVHEVATEWLHVVASVATGAICISKAVADELAEWVKIHGPTRQRPLEIGWFHLGADVDNSAPTTGLPSNAGPTLEQFRSRPTFLIVGTLEPRKGHTQVLDAFEQLWLSGQGINLVIVGKQGWMVDQLVGRLRTHAELNKRLFWLEGISDEYLEKVYSASTCLIAASYGEGFGLPLIEAAQHKLPIIARDIPVFREVAGEHVFYFEDNVSSQVIADAIKDWLMLYKQDQHPKSDRMPWLTWKQSADKLSKVLLKRENLRAEKSYPGN